MLTTGQATEILRALNVLPPERVLEVQDFILFLIERYGHDKTVDESETWTDEALRDLAMAALKHASQT